MKICFFGIYDPDYSRNRILIRGLKESGVVVVECRADWRDPWRYFKLIKKLYSLKRNYDFIYAAYPSAVSTVIARLVSNKPVVSDAFYSMFEAVVHDRHEHKPWDLRSVKLLILDWFGLIFANIVITDTEEHKKYWSGWWVNTNKIHTVYMGIDDALFYPGEKKENDTMLVHFHGKYIPLQGTHKIVEAAHLLQGKDIKFRMIGTGQDYNSARALADNYKLNNMEFMDRVSLPELNKYISEADMVLGIFGETAKAKRVIANKVYEGLAAKKPVVTMDTSAIREIFSEKDLLLVENDPISIAEGIWMLSQNKDIRESLAESGYSTVCKYRPKNVAQSLLKFLQDTL